MIKANGDTEPFDEDKIRRSLIRSGTAPDMVDTIIGKVGERVYDNITTRKLYKIVFNELQKRRRPAAGKYHLKNAIMELGPTGFPFESFVASLFRADGYQVITGEMVEGHCVKHEVDVIADNGKDQFMMECKFHSRTGTVCDVKTALYVRARFWDIEKKLAAQQGKDSKLFKGWLVTNTRLTADAEQYGICSGLALMSWNFPAGQSLRERIDASGLYPVTCITSLSREEKEKLLAANIVLCKDLAKTPEVLGKIGISESRAQRITEEALNISRGNMTVHDERMIPKDHIHE
ncbi:restriction endonuclease [Chitinophaga oryzae]|uniref:Restriction endonuclease n=1 Tax=Chitinophaga oryzae TaxID=2725414 RepID=A0AAE7D4U0_9BACT|nr:ATP cone domain-containing protein [Chitinophaga oryzae]QJB29833.1 restriction endonuclease [Chitinophaga oryzae]QJB36389.1 restriction endonuclease [Chitinophaga oryzae]